MAMLMLAAIALVGLGRGLAPSLHSEFAASEPVRLSGAERFATPLSPSLPPPVVVARAAAPRRAPPQAAPEPVATETLGVESAAQDATAIEAEAVAAPVSLPEAEPLLVTPNGPLPPVESAGQPPAF